jgi:hypothetical protein
MMRLENVYEDFIKLSDLNSGNVDIADIAENDDVNENLIKDIETAAKNAGLKVKITHAVTGHRTHTSSGTISRHTKGNAVDINTIDGVGGNTSGFKEKADKLVGELKKLGYEHTTSESGKPKVVIWNSPEHYGHIHISISDGTSSSGTSSSSQTSDDDEFSFIDVLKKVTGRALNLDEEIGRFKTLIK